MDILLTGGTGQVGIELQRQKWPEGVVLHAPTRCELDLLDPNSIRRILDSRQWSAVINSGAYTAVDRAEVDVETAWRVNALAPAVLTRASAEAQIPIIQVSTDYVFDGTKDGYYVEDDPVRPINVYGASKQGGEQAVRTANPHHAIIRTSWVVSPHGSNFLKTMLRLAGEREEVAVVADQRGCPTFSPDLAAALKAVTLALLSNPGLSGTYHFANEGEASWADLARAIFAISGERGGPFARVRETTTAEFPTPAKRPRNSRLHTGKIKALLSAQPRPWTEALKSPNSLPWFDGERPS